MFQIVNRVSYALAVLAVALLFVGFWRPTAQFGPSGLFLLLVAWVLHVFAERSRPAPQRPPLPYPVDDREG